MLRKNKDQELWESKSRWEASLSNGETIYQDDSDGFPSWILLGRYIKENNLKIVNLSFGFRDNMVQLKPNADGYFFRNMATGSIAGTQWGTLCQGYRYLKICLIKERQSGI